MLTLDNRLDLSDTDYQMANEFSKDSVLNKHFGLDSALPMPFKYSKDKILNNDKTLTVRRHFHKGGIYRLDDKLVRVILKETGTLDEYLETSGKTKEEFLREFLGKGGKIDKANEDFAVVNKWLDGGKVSLYVYELKLAEEDDLTYEDSDFKNEEDFENTFLANFLAAKEQQIKRIRNQAKLETENPLRKARLQSVAKSLDKQRRVLKSSFNMDIVIKQAYADVQILENLLERPEGLELEDIKEMYAALSGHGELINNFKQYLDLDNDSKLSGEIFKVEGVINSSLTSAYNFLSKTGAKLVEETTGKILKLEYNSQGLLVPVASTDTGVSKRRTLSAAESTNPLIQAAYRMIRTADSTVNTKVGDYVEEAESIFKAFYKQKGIGMLDKKEGAFSEFIKESDKGFMLISKFNDSYYSDKRVRKGSGDKALTPTQIKVGVNWFKNNHSYEVNQEADQRHLKYLKDNLGQLRAKLDKDPGLDKILTEFTHSRDFKELYKSLAEHFNLSSSDNVTDFLKRRHKTIYYFLNTASKNDPNNLKRILDNTAAASEEDLALAHDLIFTNRSFRIASSGGQSSTAPLSYEVSSEKYLDKQFKKIEDLSEDDPTKVMYEFIKSTFSKYKPLAGESKSFLPFTAIPEISKTLGLVSQVGATFDLKETVKKDQYDIDPITGDRVEILRTNTLGTNIPMEDRSLNLEAVLDAFVKDTIKYSEYKDIHSEILTIKSLLKKQKIYKLDGSDKRVFDLAKDGKTKIYQYEDGLSNNYLLLQNHFNAAFYEKPRDIKVKGGKTYSRKTKKAIKKVTDQIEELQKTLTVPYEEFFKSALTTRRIDRSEKQQQLMDLIEEYERLIGSTKHITGRRIVNFLASITRKKLLGFNAMGLPVEWLEGFTKFVSLTSNPDLYFSMKDLALSYKSMITKIKFTEKDDIQHMLQFFNLNTDEIYGSKLDSSGAFNDKVNNALFYQYKIARDSIGYMFMESMLRGNKKFIIKDKNGEEHRLFDVMRFEGRKLVLPDTFDQNMFIDAAGRPTKLKIDMELFLTTVMKQQRERSDKTDPIELNNSNLGVLVSIFRSSWMFNQINYRFGKYQEYDVDTETFVDAVNPLTGHKQKGYYRSFFSKDLWKRKVEGEIDPYTGKEIKDNYKPDPKAAMIAIGKASIIGRMGAFKNLEGKDELTQRNVQKMMREVTITGSFFALMLLLTTLNDSGDDDEDKNRMKRAVLIALENLMTRGFRDWSAYLNPSAATSILQNATAATSVLTDVSKILQALVQSTYDPYLYEGTSRQRLRLPKVVLDAIPALRQIYRLPKKWQETQKLFK